MMEILGLPIVDVIVSTVPKIERKRGLFYTPFSLDSIFRKYQVGYCLQSKPLATVVTEKPIVYSKMINATISRNEALLLEKMLYAKGYMPES